MVVHSCMPENKRFYLHFPFWRVFPFWSVFQTKNNKFFFDKILLFIKILKSSAIVWHRTSTMVKHSIQSIGIIYVNLNWEYQIGNINPLINGFSFNVDAGCQYSKFSGPNFKLHIKLWLRKIKYLIQRFQMIAMVKVWTKTNEACTVVVMRNTPKL